MKATDTEVGSPSLSLPTIPVEESESEREREREKSVENRKEMEKKFYSYLSELSEAIGREGEEDHMKSWHERSLPTLPPRENERERETERETSERERERNSLPRSSSSRSLIKSLSRPSDLSSLDKPLPLFSSESIQHPTSLSLPSSSSSSTSLPVSTTTPTTSTQPTPFPLPQAYKTNWVHTDRLIRGSRTQVQPLSLIPPSTRKEYISQRLREDTLRLSGSSELVNKLVYDCSLPSPHWDEERDLSKRERERFRNLDIYSRLSLYMKERGSHSPSPSSLSSSPLLSDNPNPWYRLSSPEDQTLVFESRFESGNLKQAVKAREREYDLIMRADVNTTDHSQWFLFSISNVKKTVSYSFNIVNCIKADSMFNYGMQPLIYSKKREKERGIGWRREGEKISYYQNHVKRPRGKKGEKSTFFYTLSFSLSLPHDNDTVFIAYCYPYTYSDLRNDLSLLTSEQDRSVFVRRKVLCHTLAGNAVDLLTITDFSSPQQEIRERKGVLITARVHPGESNSSYVASGALEFLTSHHPQAEALRKAFVFKVIPMLNPDGVMFGNYRCGLSGEDLNRQW